MNPSFVTKQIFEKADTCWLDERIAFLFYLMMFLLWCMRSCINLVLPRSITLHAILSSIYIHTCISPPPTHIHTLPPASKDGGRLDQLVLYRDAPASDFLGGKTLAAECPPFYTWPNLLRGYCR